MTDLGATEKVKRVQISAVVIRADGSQDDLGVVADSANRWRFGAGRVGAWWRTRRANRRANV